MIRPDKSSPLPRPHFSLQAGPIPRNERVARTGSVEAGGGFGALGRELGATRLGSNARQVAEWERAALDALREGRAGEAAAAYSHHGRVHRSTNPAELIGDMVERWWAAQRVRR